jgi:molybdopterin-containing oxidoreductase family membrane subunit
MLIGLGGASFVYQIVNGIGVTGLKEPVVWGIYVVNFAFFFGLGAGLLMLLLFGSIKQAISDEFMLMASFTAFICLGLAGIFIILDLGRIDRFFYILIYAQPKSTLVWDLIVMNIFMAISVIFCFIPLRRIFLKRGLKEKASFAERLIFNIITAKEKLSLNESLLKKTKLFVLFLIVGLYGITSEVFIGMKARPEWHTPVLGLVFLISSVLCGFSVMMLLESFYVRVSPAEEKKTFFSPRSKFLSFLLCADLTLILIKYGMDKGNPLIQKVHQLFPFSFIIFLIVGNLLPILFLSAYKDKKSILYQLAPILILFGILSKRTEIIITAYFRRWLPFPSEPTYLPTFPEVFMVLGIYSAGIVVLTVAFYLAIPYIKQGKNVAA